jgi:hypothetical protein
MFDAYFISVTGGRVLADSTPWIVNTASSATCSFTSVWISLKVVGPSKRLTLYFVCHCGFYMTSVLARFSNTIIINLRIPWLGLPNGGQLFLRSQMRFSQELWLFSVLLKSRILYFG